MWIVKYYRKNPCRLCDSIKIQKHFITPICQWGTAHQAAEDWSEWNDLKMMPTAIVCEGADIDATWINVLRDTSKSYIIDGKRIAIVCEHPKSQATPVADTQSLSMFLWLWSYPVNIYHEIICFHVRSSSNHGCDCFLWPWFFLLAPIVFTSGDETHSFPILSASLKVWLPPIMCGTGTMRPKKKVAQNGLGCFFHLFCMLTTQWCYMWSGTPLCLRARFHRLASARVGW